MVEDGGNASHWQTFFDIEAPLLRERPLFVSIGNHELFEDAAGASFSRYFGFTGDADAGTLAHLFGTLRWGSARLFFLNAFHDWRSGDERDWLERTLARADTEAGLVWRIAVVHHGPWSAGPHGPNAKIVAAGLVDLLAAHKLDLVLSGHDHIYERGEASVGSGGKPGTSMKYVVSGGGGAPLYRVVQPLGSTRKAEASLHFVEAHVTADAIRINAKRVDGSLLEQCGFKKGASWDCDTPAPAAAAVPAPSPATPSSPASPPATGSSACACGTAGTRGSALVSALGVLACLIWLARHRYSRRRCDPASFCSGACGTDGSSRR
jgi:hypothetical protein